jgi:hypothetical protein
MSGGNSQSPRTDFQSNIHGLSFEQYHTHYTTKVQKEVSNQNDTDLHHDGSKLPFPSNKQQKHSHVEEGKYEFLQRFVSGCLNNLDKLQAAMTSWSEKDSVSLLRVKHGSRKEVVQEREEESVPESNKNCVHKQEDEMDNAYDKHNSNISFYKSESDQAHEKRNGKETDEVHEDEQECPQEEERKLLDLSSDSPDIPTSNSPRAPLEFNDNSCCTTLIQLTGETALQDYPSITNLQIINSTNADNIRLTHVNIAINNIAGVGIKTKKLQNVLE